MTLKDFLSEQGYSRIKLKLLKSNHFEMRATINGVKGRFILDTGASNTLIDQQLGEEFKLKIKKADVKVTGAGATDMDSQISTANHLKIGKWSNRRSMIVLFNLTHVNTGLAVNDVEPIQGIIGTDVLKKAGAVIDYEKKYLYLKPNN